jgi:hypothetical protein
MKRRVSASGQTRIDKRARQALLLALSLLAQNAVIAPAYCQAQATKGEPPGGTVLLPLTPKLDDGASPAFDRSPPGDTDDGTEGNEPHKIRATTAADLKPAPDAITPEQGNIEEQGPPEDALAGGAKLMKGMVQIVADDTEFDSANNTFLGTGNAVAIIGGQNSKLEADTILYNQDTNIMDARGNVRVLRDGNLTSGSAFKFNITSDQYLITSPNTDLAGSEIIARTGIGKGSSIDYRNGTVVMQKPFVYSTNTMYSPLSYREGMAEFKQHPEAFVPPNPSYTFKARKIVYEKYKEEDNLTIFGGKLMFGNFGIPLPKMVTTTGNQNNVTFPISALVSNNLQSGGINVGPAFNTAIGRTGVLMWAPMVQFGGKIPSVTGVTPRGSDIGLAGQTSFNNYFMTAHVGYGTVSNLMVSDFKLRIRKGFRFQSGINRYIDDGMMGARRARAIAEFVDNHPISNIPLLAAVNFRTSAGWAQDNPQLVNQTSAYAHLFGNVTSTDIKSAMRFQEQVTASTQPIFRFGDSNFGIKSFISGGAAARGYSTGDKNALGQIGPVIDLYLNRVRLQAGYTQSAYSGTSPFVFDEFIQGTRSTFLSGDFRINKWITLGGSLGYNLVDKLYYAKTVTAAIGPPDFKLLLSGNMIQASYRVGFNLLYGQPVPFDKLVLKSTPDQGQLGGI